MLPNALLRQLATSRELRVAGMMALTHQWDCRNSLTETVAHHLDFLKKGALPVGDVPFVRACLQALNKRTPVWNCYPASLSPWLHRTVKQMSKQAWMDAGAPTFIKPFETKLFTGALLSPAVLEQLAPVDWQGMGPFLQEQYQALAALPLDTVLWASEPVNWDAEFRYYVLDHRVIGVGRYDDGPDLDSKGQPFAINEAVVADIIEAFRPHAPRAYALDVGLLDSGETALVEANDGWALGFYSGSLEPLDYMRFLHTRWQEMTHVAA